MTPGSLAGVSQQAKQQQGKPVREEEERGRMRESERCGEGERGRERDKEEEDNSMSAHRSISPGMSLKEWGDGTQQDEEHLSRRL